jgi:hypothetical protein
MEDFKLRVTPGNTKATMKEADASSSDLWKVGLQYIQTIDGFNVRVDNAARNLRINAIAESILANGYMMDKPLAGYIGSANTDTGQAIYLPDGHTRLAAVKLANAMGATIDRLPVVVKPNSTSAEDLTVALVTSNSGTQLAPYEIGVVAKRLVGYGWEPAVISKRLVLSTNYINDLLLLMGSDSEIRQLVVDDKVSASTAIDAIKMHGAGALKVLMGAFEVATEKGKTKATAKDMPGAEFMKACKKSGEEMYWLIYEMLADPAYTSLNRKLQDRVKGLFAKIPEDER